MNFACLPDGMTIWYTLSASGADEIISIQLVASFLCRAATSISTGFGRVSDHV